MFFNAKFSILKAYITSFKINFEYIAFYMVWQFIVWVFGTALLIYLAIVMDILDPHALMQNYHLIGTYFLKLFTDISTMTSKISTIVSGHEPYDILKSIFPENILNSSLENMSWSEYLHVILMPKKLMLGLIMLLSGLFIGTTSMGYIKTALKFQSGQKASLHDLYQNFYLIPQFLLVGLTMLSIFLLPVITFLGMAKFSGLIKGVFFVFSIIIAAFLYQRLRFMQYFIIDKEISVFAACKTSWKVTKGNVFHLFIYSMVSSLLFTHPGVPVFYLLFFLISHQADVNIYKQMTE